MGEVELYFIENPYLKIENPTERYPEGKTLSLQGVKAIFMGSDYNFIFSPEMQSKVLRNCIDDNRSTYMRFSEYKPVDWRIQRMLATNGREQDDSGNMNEIDNHIHEIVYQSFRDSNMYMYNGLILGIYRILGVVTFLVGMTGALG